jgi:hypothetical protein
MGGPLGLISLCSVVSPDLTPGHCSYGGNAWVVESSLDAKGRTLVSVQYALEGSIEKNVELARITPVQIPQHASVRPRRRTTITTIRPRPHLIVQ